MDSKRDKGKRAKLRKDYFEKRRQLNMEEISKI